MWVLQKFKSYNLLIYSKFDFCNRLLHFYVKKTRNTRKTCMLRVVENIYYLYKF